MENTGNPKKVLNKGEEIAKRDSSELHVLLFDTSQEAIFELEAEQNYALANEVGGEETILEEKVIEDMEKRDKEKTENFVAEIKQNLSSDVIISTVDNSIKSDIVKYSNDNGIDLIILGKDDALYSRRSFDSLIKHLINKTNSDLFIVR